MRSRVRRERKRSSNREGQMCSEQFSLDDSMLVHRHAIMLWAGAWKGMPSVPYAQRVPLHLGSNYVNKVMPFGKLDCEH